MTGFRINPNSAAQAELLAGTSIDTFTGGVSLQFLASPAAPGTARIQFGSYTNGQWYSQLDILNNQSGTTADVYLMQAGQGNLGIRTNNPKAPIHIGGSPTANANYGTLSMGTTASFDGATAGKFSGSANGTFFAINKTTGSANYLDFQNNGISLYKVDPSGSVTSGIWNATVISPLYGGTGIANNTASTITVSGSFATTLNISGTTNITLPISGTLATLAGTETITNKRITKRVLALSANSATPTIDTNSYDVVHITSQSANITSFTTNLSGTPVDGDTLRISITDAGTPVTIAWGASFEDGAATLPTITVASTRLDIGFFWNTETTKWRCMAQG